MAAIGNVWVKRETILQLAESLKNNPDTKGIGVDFGINDEVNQWNQNVSMWMQQTKDQRDAKNPKYYIANGAMKWKNDQGILIPPKKGDIPTPSSGSTDIPKSQFSDLPF